MGRKVGRWTLRWAEGPGRQSGLWALSAAAVAALPFLDLVRPECAGAQACQAGWDRLFFVPNLVFVPAILAISVMVGSWMAQRLHERRHKRFFAELDASKQPEIPPGHFRPPELERDLQRRSMRWMALGSLAAVGIFVYFAMTPIGRRSCDPWQFKQPTGLEVCQGAAQWSDALIAYEVWLFITAGVVWSLLLFGRARRLREPKEKRDRAALRDVKRAKAAGPTP